MKGLAGKNVLVTGASVGIGRACAVRFAEEGAHVVINHRKSEAAALQTLAEVRAHSDKSLIVQADVSKEDDVTRLFETTLNALGGIDILINNAGFLFAAESDKLTMDDFDRVINTNLRGAFMCAQQAIRHFLAAGKAGVIINLSSVHQTIPKPTFVHYAISKGGMQNMTTTLALEYANRGIRVNAVAPGATVTPMNAGWTDDPAARAAVERHIPLGRSGEAWEMAALTAFLCSDEAAYITGQTIYVDGGLTLYNDFRENWST
ncbi:MAG: glucose 1-dehydrogenase [Chloroflexota bacterium]|nr:glucose 1-dehydrogenase [Chloroflexota bacterium]